MRVVHFTRHATQQPGWCDNLDAMLDRSNFVSLHIPLAPETHHPINAERLDRIGPSGELVNPARGPIVDEEALATALHQGRPFAAGIDVYERVPSVSPQLLSAPRAVLLPHIGSATF